MMLWGSTDPTYTTFAVLNYFHISEKKLRCKEESHNEKNWCIMAKFRTFYPFYLWEDGFGSNFVRP